MLGENSVRQVLEGDEEMFLIFVSFSYRTWSIMAKIIITIH